MDLETLDRPNRPEGSETRPDGLRIALLSYRSAPNVGGQGVYVGYLSQALAMAGHRVDVISGPPYPDLDPRVGLHKLASLDLYAQPHNGHFALRPRHLTSPTDTYEYFGHLSGKFVEPYTFGQRAFAFLKANRGRYDIVLDNQTLSAGILAVQDRLGLPLVTMIHHPITQDRRLALEAARNWKQRFLVRRWYDFHHMQVRVARRLSHIIAPSRSAKRDIVTEFAVPPGRVTPLPLGVDRQAFRPRPEISRHPKQIITTASADVPLKGLSILIEAVADLLNADPDLEMVVIGTLRDGRARRLIEKLGLKGRIRFRSGLSRAALGEAFATATLAVTPSLYEGFGLPAAEAMSCATPVIVTDGGALPEVAGDAGIVIPRGDAVALRAAISDLLDDPARQAAVGKACLARAETVFDWSRIVPHYEAVFRDAMAVAC